MFSHSPMARHRAMILSFNKQPYDSPCFSDSRHHPTKKRTLPVRCGKQSNERIFHRNDGLTRRTVTFLYDGCASVD